MSLDNWKKKNHPASSVAFRRSANFFVTLLVASFLLRSAGATTALDPEPEDSSTLFGAACAVVGDLNGDGIPDLAVGAPYQDGDFNNSSPGFGPPQNVGKVFLLDGANLRLLRTIDDPVYQMRQSFRFGGQFGTSIAATGDLNGDGIGDVVVGIPHHIFVESADKAAFNAGRAIVFNGKTGSILFTLDDPTPEEGARCGFAVAGLGDVNGDGVSDILVGVPKKNSADGLADVGATYIFSGANGSLIRTLNPPAQTGANARFGSAVANAGDVDHDGVSDMLIGAPGASRAYVYSGASSALLFTLTSPKPESLPSFGMAVAGGQDVNGDGSPDFVIGAPLQKTLQGAAYVFSGSNGALLRSLRNTRQDFSKFGAAVAMSPDLTGDGRPDVLVGAPDQKVDGLANAGEILIFNGRTNRLFLTRTAAAPKAFSAYGSAIATADFGSNGTVQTVVGAPFQNANITEPDGDVHTHLQIGQIEIQ
ncbi:MAG: integrin alpha [Chthoniobacterales bacterium]